MRTIATDVLALSVGLYVCVFLPRDAVLARYKFAVVVCPSTRLSQPGILSKRLEESTYPTVCCKEIRVSLGLGERCKLPSAGSAEIKFLCILALKSDIWWHEI